MKLGGAARLVSRGDVLWFRAPALGFHSDVEHGVTHASLGNFSLTQAIDAREVEERRARLLEAAGLGDATLFAPPLHHSANVGRVAGGRIVDAGGHASDGRRDALVSNEPGTVLAVTVADCVPVFFVDVVEVAFGVAHAGWRGIFGGIVRRTVDAMMDEFGTKPGNLLVGAGPAIRGPSYEVGPEVAGLFPEPFTVPVGDPAEGRAQVDLPSCALADAAGAGVPKDNLVDFSPCTYEHAGDLFSHRRGDRERHWAFIGRS
ncbi:MAG: polyphenol oxidase family protein [bacterium]